MTSINEADAATFTITHQVTLMLADFEAGRQFAIHMARSQAIEEFERIFNNYVEKIRQELNEADPMTIRPPMDALTLPEPEDVGLESH